MKKVFMSVFAIAVILVACQKDDAPTETTLSQLQHKWGVTNVLTEQTGEEPETYTGIATDYIEFRNDGKLYSNLADSKDTVAYILTSANKLVIDGDTTQIKQLTPSLLQLVEQSVTAGDTIHITYNLKK